MYFDKTLDLILEDLESKMDLIVQTLLAKKSRWRGKQELVQNPQDKPKEWILVPDAPQQTAQWVRDNLGPYDPTDNHRYSRYIAKQVALGNLNAPEDGPAILRAIDTFDRSGKDWPGHTDIFKYHDYRELSKETAAYMATKDTSSGNAFYEAATKELESRAYQNTKEIFRKDDIPTSVGDAVDENGTTKIEMYEASSWEAAMWWGWKGLSNDLCTSAGGNATQISPYLANRQTAGRTMVETVGKAIEPFFSDGARKEQKQYTIWADWSKRDFIDDIYKLNEWDQNAPLESIKASTIVTANHTFLWGMHNSKNYGYEHRNEPIYILRKGNKPFQQFTCQMGGGECQDATNTEFSSWDVIMCGIIGLQIVNETLHPVAAQKALELLKRSLQSLLRKRKDDPDSIEAIHRVMSYVGINIET